MIRVLYDGWSLIYGPNSPAALHLLAILARLPSEVMPEVALPLERPPWLPELKTHINRTENTATARLIWEQRYLPNLASEIGAHLIHLTSLTPPLFTRVASVISPTGFTMEGNITRREKTGAAGHPHEKRPIGERLREALSQGGLTRVRGLLVPDDLPLSGASVQQRRLPPVVHPDFSLAEDHQPDLPAELDLPDTYVLYHGSGSPSALSQLLEAWSWAGGSIGEYYPLVILGLDDKTRTRLNASLTGSNLASTLRLLPPLPPLVLPHLYRKCSALLHVGGIAPWGDPIRHAMACGKPVVSVESTLADALVGPAAYLAPPGDHRALGAAVITVIVEEGVAERLSQSARKRVQEWQSGDFDDALLAAYQELSAHARG